MLKFTKIALIKIVKGKYLKENKNFVVNSGSVQVRQLNKICLFWFAKLILNLQLIFYWFTISYFELYKLYNCVCL